MPTRQKPARKRRKPTRLRLTRERVRQIEPPATGEITVWDTEVTGLGVRCLSSKVKSYVVMYRAGYGREGVARRITLGKVNGLRLEDARDAALDIRGRVAKGEDPVAQRRIQRREAKRPALSLEQALDRYDKDQTRRKVAGRKNVQSSLRRHLLGHVGDLPLSELGRRTVIEAVEALEAKGLPGAAESLRGHASTFLKWCADRGLIPANPLQGYRAPRATRAQRIAQPGRSLRDSEVSRVWAACEAEGVNAAFGQLVRMLILTGQRRTETARMRWADLDEKRLWWRIPAEQTKNGIAHEVPLPPLARAVIAAAPKHDKCEYVFSTNGESPISGFSKLEPRLRERAALTEPWTLHDLRRTFRSGLTRLGVEPDVAEVMLNHRPETLRAVYDRDPRLDARKKAAERWANHVRGILDPASGANVVKLSEAG